MKKRKENEYRKKKETRISLVARIAMTMQRKISLFVISVASQAIPEFDEFFSRVLLCRQYFTKPMKLLSQLKYCNGTVGIFRGILLNEIKLIVIKIIIKNFDFFFIKRFFNKANDMEKCL